MNGRAAIMIVVVLGCALTGCGGGGGGGTAQPSTTPPASTPGVVGNLTATDVPSAISQLQSKFPNLISSTDVAQLSAYSLVQENALAGSGTTSLFEGEWYQYANGNGNCYVVTFTTYNQNCGVLLTSQGQSITQPEGDVVIAGTLSTTANSGSFSGKDLTNGSLAQGNYKIYYGYQALQTNGNVTTLPFAVLEVGDVSSGGTYSYSELKEYVGTVTVSASGQLSCSLSSVQTTPIAGVFGRYKQIILAGGSTLGLALDYDFIWAPATQGSVAAAPISCTTNSPVHYTQTLLTSGFASPEAIAVGTSLVVADDSNCDLVIACSSPYKIYSVDLTGTASVLAGNGTAGYVEGPGASASFNSPRDVAGDPTGVYVADFGNNAIRKISPTGIVSTFATVPNPRAVAVDPITGTVYVASNRTIVRISSGGVTSTLAGSDFPGHADGTGASASFTTPVALAWDFAAQGVYVADNDLANGFLREVTDAGVVTTFAGNGTAQTDIDGVGRAASLTPFLRITSEAGSDVYATETSGLIRKVTRDGTVTTVTHLTEKDSNGASYICTVLGGISVDNSGNVYVGSRCSGDIYKLTPN
jgi:hypothetical protein